MNKHEIYRKLVHLFAIIIPVLYYFVVKSDFISICILLPIALFCVIVDAARMENPELKNKFFKVFGMMLREHESKGLTGASYLLTSSIVVIALPIKEITFLAISYLVVGDTLASLVGLKFGKRRIVSTMKTVEGLIASFIGCTIWGLIFNLYFFEIGLHQSIIIFGAIVASITEVSNLHINDNISIPIISGLAMSLIYLIL